MPVGNPDILVPASVLLRLERMLGEYREALEWIAGCDPAESGNMITYAESVLGKYPKEARIEE